jgi:hypothetical protein
VTPSEIEHETFQLVEQRLNQLKRKEMVGVGGENSRNNELREL